MVTKVAFKIGKLLVQLYTAHFPLKTEGPQKTLFSLGTTGTNQLSRKVGQRVRETSFSHDLLFFPAANPSGLRKVGVVVAVGVWWTSLK